MPEHRIRRLEVDEETRDTIQQFLREHSNDAFESRQTQVDGDYTRWLRNYRGEPAEKRRTVPWYGASNYVVKIIRIFVDTFVARTLNIIFSTRPLYVMEGIPRKQREALQYYFNLKAMHELDHYLLARELLNRGNKFGTAIAKTAWLLDQKRTMYDGEDRLETVYEGPRSRVIPFQDFAVYPIRAERTEDVEMFFHRVRWTPEAARQRIKEGKWTLPQNVDLEQLIKQHDDMAAKQAQTDAGVDDRDQQQVVTRECYLDYTFDNGATYPIVGVLTEDGEHLLDLWHSDRPPFVNTFETYTPFPRENLFYGESMCELLEQSQEETSSVHNERRNASYLANAPIFKRRQGARIPDPSSSWYPGKVWDLEDMNDFEVILLGGNYNSMLEEESFTLQLAERLSGISAPLQGFSQGRQDKRGVYNAMGTIAMMQEGNQRQDTNIRDVRHTMGRIAKNELMLQKIYMPEGGDPIVALMPEDMQIQVVQAVRDVPMEQLRHSRFEVKVSHAGANSEVYKASLMQMVNVMGQYGATVQQLATHLADPELNQSLRVILNDVVRMHKWMAERLLRAFDEYDAEGVLPDVRAAIEQTVPGGGATSEEITQGPGEGGMEFGGPEGPATPLTREQLQNFSQMVPTFGGGE